MVGLSSTQYGYSIGDATRLLTGGGDGVWTLTINAPYWYYMNLYVFSRYGCCTIEINDHRYGAKVTSWAGNLRLSCVLTYHPGPNNDNTGYSTLQITPGGTNVDLAWRGAVIANLAEDNNDWFQNIFTGLTRKV